MTWKFPLLALVVLGLGPIRAEADGDAATCKKVIFIGDSITHHGPEAQLGWAGNWGMAASAENMDYAHLFLAKLKAARADEGPETLILAEGGGKIPDRLAEAQRIIDFHADLALVQLGENDNKDVSVEGFQIPYESLLQAIRTGNPKAVILCAGVWGFPRGDATKNAMIRAACRKMGAIFVSLDAAAADPANSAKAEHRFQNEGVNWHPGDKGMEAYAEAFWQGLQHPAPPAAEVAAPKKETLAEEAWTGAGGLDWAPKPGIEEKDGVRAAKVAATDAAYGTQCMAILDPVRFRGRLVTVRTRVKGEGISEKLHPWNGIRLGFISTNAEGQADYPQFRLPVGTFDWIEVKWTIFIPDNVVSLKLSLGLDQAKGTVWFDALRIATED